MSETKMRILCLCQQGNSRSVALAFLLKRHYHADALAAGLVTASKETLDMLYDWAEHIIVTDKELVAMVPENVQGKLHLWDVGTDIWFRRPARSLTRKLYDYMEQNVVWLPSRVR